jgi:hypothetical protein
MPFVPAIGSKKGIYANFQVSSINLPYTVVKSPMKNQEKLT